jgi:hypothetical protein
MTRNKISSLINIGGLATGIACVILILLYAQDERKFDQFAGGISVLIFTYFASNSLTHSTFSAGKPIFLAASAIS